MLIAVLNYASHDKRSATIKVGEIGTINLTPKPKKFFAFASEDYVVIKYNGMTENEGRFILSSVFSTAVNTYYSSDKKEILFYTIRFNVDYVDPDLITLTYLGKIR